MAIEKLIYVADPMCSWCWGFSPQISKLRDYLADQVEISLIMGRLRDGHAWDEEFRQHLRTNWNEIARRTGQPFTTLLLEKPLFDYTTEPACRAVVAVRLLNEPLAYDALEMLQRAFYEKALDITDEEVIIDVLSPLRLDTLAATLDDEKSKQLAQQDKNRARLYGANVFPSLVVMDDQGHLTVIRGYRTFDELKKLLAV